MTTVPVFSSLRDALEHVAPDTEVSSRRAVGGGDINRAYRLTLTDGSDRFVKANTPSLLPMFQAEAEGLAAMKATGTIGVPEALAVGLEPAELGRDASFLMLAWLTPGETVPHFWETFAEELAAMHAAGTSILFPERGGQATFGFPIDNYIGSTPQVNTPHSCWVEFFRACRLHPQVRMAYDGGFLERSAMRQADAVMERLDTLLPEPDHPSLLHGDLWSGNFMPGPDGRAWLIDPATYVGHREADLAMTELFGGFSAAFYATYRSIAHVDPEYDDRRDLYNLYHLLNHVNLFGFSYVGQVTRILNRFGG